MSEPTDFSAEYAKMSELELLELARDYDGLTEPAQTAIRSEFAKRHLEPPLIDETEEKPEWRELVTVKTFRDLTEATVAQTALESAGIAVYLFDDNLLRNNWFLSNLIGGVRLKVKREDENAARELLNQPVPLVIEFAENGESYTQPRCLKCGSININFDGASRGTALVGLYAAGIPLPTGRKSWSCDSCGARWEQTDN